MLQFLSWIDEKSDLRPLDAQPDPQGCTAFELLELLELLELF